MDVALLNTRSLVNKLNKFVSFVYSSNYSIICCTETWLSADIFDNEILPSGYCIYRKDRKSRGGGVMITVKDNIPSVLVASPSELEVVSTRIGSKSKVTICTVYIPPSATDQYHTSLIDYLKYLNSMG